MLFKFEEIQSPSAFDAELKNLSEGSVFVSEAWLDFTAKASSGRFIGLRIRDGAGKTGLFAGVLFRRLGLKIIGSPFPGWGTSYMGVCGMLPLDHSLVSELLTYLFGRYGAHYIEMINPPGTGSLTSGIGYTVSQIDSLLLPLVDGQEVLYAHLQGDCRTCLRQFDAKGGAVVAVSPDSEFADQLYDQLTEVFARQGMVTTHSRQRIGAMLAALEQGQADLLCLQARGPAGEQLASSVFFGANGVFYYWAGASYVAGRHFRPTEAMIWEAIRHFIGLGYHSFDMMGVRDYKLKFSPRAISYTRIASARPAFLLILRDWAQHAYYVVNRLLGRAGADRGKQPLRLTSNLVLKAVEEHEFVHYQSDDLCIYTDSNIVHIKGRAKHRIELPLQAPFKLLARLRLLRRLTRLDKSCVIPTVTGLIIIWQGAVYHWSETSGLRKTLVMKGCRNPMHNSIARIDELTYVFGEYGRPQPEGKNIYKTTDGGLTWNVAFNFPASAIRHVHNCIWDPHTQRIWIFTGDYDGQCKIVSMTADFNDPRYYGDGSQVFRATGAFIDAKYVHWIMDSPLEEVRHVRMNKATGEIVLGQTFPGPVYYYTRTRDGLYLVCTAQEPGPSVSDRKVHLYASRNLKKWVPIGAFEHDGFPRRLFRFGVGVFPAGNYDSDDVMMSFDSIKSFDGKVIRLCVKGV
jgi:Acetyltransferase (GNAT) domain